MTDKDNTDLLMGLGLSPNQAKVYHSILKAGDATVRTIAKSSALRREDIYKVLPALEKMGLTEKLLGKPARIRATPVAGALTSLIVDEKVKGDEKIATMKAKFQLLSKAKWVQPIVVGEEDSLYALIQERKAVLAKTSILVASTKEQIFWIENQGGILYFLAQYSDEFNRAIRRRVNVRVIFEDCLPDDNLRKQLKQLLDTELVHARFHRQLLNRFVVFDGKEAMINTQRKSEPAETQCLWTTDSNLIGVLRGYFENAWRESEELKQINKQPK